MKNLYFDFESENVLQEKNDKWRIIDTSSGEIYARYQKVKTDKEGDYLLNQGLKNYINFEELEAITVEELS